MLLPMHGGNIAVHIKLREDAESHPNARLLELADAPVHAVTTLIGAKDLVLLKRCGIRDAGVDRLAPLGIHQELKALQALLLRNHGKVSEATRFPPHFVGIIVVPSASNEELEGRRPLGWPKLGARSLKAALREALSDSQGP
eukprot:UN3655